MERLLVDNGLNLFMDVPDKPNEMGELKKSEDENEEARRCKDGFWFLHEGNPTYITGAHYFFLFYFRLKDGRRPVYRDRDRLHFYLSEVCKDKNIKMGLHNP